MNIIVAADKNWAIAKQQTSGEHSGRYENVPSGNS